MNFTLPKQSLLRILTATAPATDPKGPMPLLACILLEALTDTVTAVATDLFVAARASAPATVTKPGSVAVPARDLLDRVKVLGDGPVTVTADNHRLTLKQGKREFRLPTSLATDYPKLPPVPATDPDLVLTQKQLHTLIDAVAYAVSDDETRPNLNSALLTVQDGIVRMVATDGHRMSICDLPVEHPRHLVFLVPLKALKQLRKLDAETVDFTLTNAGLSVCQGRLQFKLPDTVFPPYQQVIPKTKHWLETDAVPLIEAIKAVAVSAPHTKGLRLTLLTEGLIRVQAESPDSGEGVDELPCGWDGPELTVGINYAYLLEALTAAGAGTVRLGLNGELDPMVVRGSNEGFTGVVMPMRV